MRILFYGRASANIGPENINKGIISNLTDSFVYVSGLGKYQEMIPLLTALLRSDAVVVSGVSRKAKILVRAAKILRKPSVYIMHGCAEYEAYVNQVQTDKKGLAQAAFLMEKVDLILPVSRKFMCWVQEKYPQYAHKTDFLFNGIVPTLFENDIAAARDKRTVVASGGLLPIKNNKVVMDAIKKLEGNAILKIYGGQKEECLSSESNTVLMGEVPHEEFLKGLSEASLFVLNSVFESFSIATMEALACGCSILVSEVAGVTDILPLEESDLIHDPMDVEEIRGKIEYLLDHPNHERIRAQFDINEWSFGKMVQRLEKHCEAVLKRS